MKLNKKMIIMMASVVGVIVVLIIVLLLFASGGSKNLSYSEIEERIVTSGKSYYEDNEDKLPTEGDVELNISTLVSEGYMNELSTYTDNGDSCSGKLIVTKTPNDYSYYAYLDCGNEYTTSLFSEYLKKDVVTNGPGLYEMEQVVPGSDETSSVYIYRGDNVNNYIKVGDYLWQVVKILDNGEIVALGDSSLLRATWDDRYNIDTNYYNGINDYEISRIREFINSDVIEPTDMFVNIKGLITPHTACVANRTKDDTSRDGSTECSKTLENEYFSLLPIYDYMNASLDENCQKVLNDSCSNYNYLSSSSDSSWWLATGVGDDTESVYYVDGKIETSYGSYNRSGRLMVHLNKYVSYVSGSGTVDDPYVIK